MKKVIRIFLYILSFIFLFLYVYCNALIGVDSTSKKMYQHLKTEIKRQGYQTHFFVISGRRYAIDNWLLNKFGSASSKSKHLKGQAIDIIVLDVNNDGSINSVDVDIVYKILDNTIVLKKGGLGTYKKQKGFFSQQMIHFDSRGNYARWNY